MSGSARRACTGRCWRSCFEPDFFEQGGESWVDTQAVQTGKNTVFPDPRYASVFVLQALRKTSKGFIVIAQTCVNEAEISGLDICPLSEFAQIFEHLLSFGLPIQQPQQASKIG